MVNKMGNPVIKENGQEIPLVWVDTEEVYNSRKEKEIEPYFKETEYGPLYKIVKEVTITQVQTYGIPICSFCHQNLPQNDDKIIRKGIDSFCCGDCVKGYEQTEKAAKRK